jgi:hypothetical protein
MRIKQFIKLVALLSGGALLGACDNDSPPPTPVPPPPPPPPASFTVSVTNLTNAQPLSPVALIAHQPGYLLFTVGNPATVGFEEMAEGGDNSALITEADADANVASTASGAAPIGPAASETITISVPANLLPSSRLSVATMLVNTNDAFTGLNAWPVGAMSVGDVAMMNAVAYDAGTEADTEAAGTIPGPAGGGEGFNAARDDDSDQVGMHSGVVSGDDGLTTSDLTEQHRFDNPVARIRIERTN